VPPRVVATANCRGGTHRIALSRRGSLVLLDHPDLARERDYIALGGDVPNCLGLLRLLSRDTRFHGEVPAELRPYVEAASRKREERSHRKLVMTSWQYTCTVKERWHALIRLAAWSALSFCQYDFPGPPGSFDFTVPACYSVGEPLEQPALCWQSPPKGNAPTGFADHGTLNLLLPWRWWRAVHKAHIATVYLPPGWYAHPRQLFVQDNLTPGQRNPLVRVLVQDADGWQSRRARLCEKTVRDLYPLEERSMQWPRNRDYPEQR
jgi:hypothetical protein